MKIIDPHLHLIDLDEGDYDWLQPGNPPYWPDKLQLHRAFLESDLRLPQPLELAGFVHIEAGFDNSAPWRELDWLGHHCQRPFRSIGFADLTCSDFEAVVARLQQYPSFVGIRQILDKQAAELLSLKRVSTALKGLSREHLTFEAQLFGGDEKGVEQLCRQLEANPELGVCISHGGFPPLAADEAPVWKASLARLAQFPHCSIKCSGWEMVTRRWQPQWAEQVLRTVTDIFGIERVMLASNSPVCELGIAYGALWHWYRSLPTFSDAELQALCFANAQRWYRF